MALLDSFGVQAFRQKYNSEDCAAIADKKTENGCFLEPCAESSHRTRGSGGFSPVPSCQDALGRALESLYPAGCLERIATMTDTEINEYAARYGVTGKELIAGIFDSDRNAKYLNYTQ